MNLITKAALVLLTLFLVLAVGCVPDTEGEARVLRVIDGDTIEIGAGIRVRYIGIDTPETYPQVESFGLEASARNRELVEGKVVILEKDVTDKDRYGRLLRYVYVDGLFVNAELVRLGYARAISYPPDTRHQALFEQLEQEAQDAGRGMWGGGTGLDSNGHRRLPRNRETRLCCFNAASVPRVGGRPVTELSSVVRSDSGPPVLWKPTGSSPIW